jgi:hypothetical protein
MLIDDRLDYTAAGECVKHGQKAKADTAERRKLGVRSSEFRVQSSSFSLLRRLSNLKVEL